VLVEALAAMVTVDMGFLVYLHHQQFSNETII